MIETLGGVKAYKRVQVQFKGNKAPQFKDPIVPFTLTVDGDELANGGDEKFSYESPVASDTE